MVRVPTHASYMRLLSTSMQTKSLMEMYSYQATTGIKYSNYGGYGMNASNIVNMEAALAVNQTFSDNNVVLNTTIEAMSTVMESVEDSVSSFKSQLNSLLSALSDLKNGEPVTSDVSSSLSDLQTVAFAGMSLLSDALNTSVAGKYIFGAGSSSAPTKFGFTTLEEFQSYYDGINIKYPSTSNANLSSRTASAADSGDLTVSKDAGAADNEFVLSAANGFTTVAVTGGEATTGDLTFSATDNTLKSTVRGAFNTIGAGDTMIFTDENGQNKAYIVESVSADGKTITFSEDTPVAADVVYTNGAGANRQAVSISTSFAVGTVVNFSGSDDVAPTMQVIGIKDNGDLIVRADESYFGNLPVYFRCLLVASLAKPCLALGERGIAYEHNAFVERIQVFIETGMVGVDTTKTGEYFSFHQSFRLESRFIGVNGAGIHTVTGCLHSGRNHVVHKSVPEVDAVFPYLRPYDRLLEVAFFGRMTTKKMDSFLQSHSFDGSHCLWNGFCEKLLDTVP